MPKGVTSLNIKNENGSFTNVPIAVKAENVKLNNGKNLEDSVAYLDIETIDSGIEAPIKTPLYQEDVVDHLYSSSSITPLSAVQGKVLQNEIDTLKTAGTVPSDTLSSEIIDIRNGGNGKVYTSAGTAVRSQLSAKEDRSNKVSSKNPITGALLPAGKNEKYPTINFLQQFYYDTSQIDELIEQAKNQIGTADWAELKDLRVGADGEQYDNAGLSVRTNIQKVSDKIDELLNSKADKATTLAGYNITDAYTKDEINNELVAKYDSKNIEEGSTTLTPHSGSSTDAINSAQCLYTKIGKQIICNIKITLNEYNMIANSSIHLIDLPFVTSLPYKLYFNAVTNNKGYLRAGVNQNSSWLTFINNTNNSIAFVSGDTIDVTILYKTK